MTAFWTRANENADFELDNFYTKSTNLAYICPTVKADIQFELRLPRDFEIISSKQKIPLFIVFDRQNKSIYKNTLQTIDSVSYTHLRAHETVLDLVCRLLLEKKK